MLFVEGGKETVRYLQPCARLRHQAASFREKRSRASKYDRVPKMENWDQVERRPEGRHGGAVRDGPQRKS